MPLINYQATVTLTFNMEFLVNYCFDMPLSYPSFGRVSLDDFSFERVDHLKFCWIIPSGVDLQ